MASQQLLFSHSHLQALAMRNDEEIQHALDTFVSALAPPPTEPPANDVIFQSLRSNGLLSAVTGMSEEVIVSLFNLLQPFLFYEEQSQDQSHTLYLSSLLCFLSIWWYKHGTTLEL